MASWARAEIACEIATATSAATTRATSTWTTRRASTSATRTPRMWCGSVDSDPATTSMIGESLTAPSGNRRAQARPGVCPLRAVAYHRPGPADHDCGGMQVGDTYDGGADPGRAMVEEVRRVVATAAARAEETEKLGTIPSDLFDDLESTGFFQALVPRNFGGPELPMSAVSEMIVEGARADGALGWVMMVGVAQPMIISMFPESTVAP